MVRIPFPRSILGRLLAGYVIVMSLLASVCAVGAYGTGRLQGNYTHTVNVDDALLSTLTQRVKLMDDEETGLRGYLLTSDRGFLQPYTAGHALVSHLRTESAVLVRSLPDDRALLDTMSADAQAWERWARQFLHPGVPLVRGRAALPRQLEGKRLFDHFRASSSLLINRIEADRAQDLAKSHDLNTWLTRLYIATFAVAMSVTILVSWLTMRAIMRPLAALSALADAIGHGDLTRPAEVGGAREFSDLGHSMECMRERLLAEAERRGQAEEELRQMAEELAAANAGLQQQAFHDPLTGLPNRLLFGDRLEQALLTSRRTAGPMALFVLDLDGFKEVNDTLGHEAGDILLRTVAARLQAGLRESDTVARLGGDEFALVLPSMDEGSAVRLAERIAEALCQPIPLAGGPVEVGSSIGIALAPAHGSDAASLVRRADAAMYACKRNGYRQCVYRPNFDLGRSERLVSPGSLSAVFPAN